MEKKSLFLICLIGCVILSAAMALLMIPNIMNSFLKAGAKTDYPLLAVASQSMLPTLKIGDAIVIQGGLGVSNISAAYETGDIVVFHKPGNPDVLVVHRAVMKLQDGNGFYLVTKGDNNPGNDYWKIYDSYLEGKVVSVIPYLGSIALFLGTTMGIITLVLLSMSIVALLLVSVALYVTMRNETKKTATQSP